MLSGVTVMRACKDLVLHTKRPPFLTKVTHYDQNFRQRIAALLFSLPEITLALVL